MSVSTSADMIRSKKDSERVPAILSGADEGVLAFRLWEKDDESG